MQKNIQVAIDGPAGAGKSTVAKQLAQRLNYIYIDTGAMYRAVAYQILLKQIPLDDNVAVASLLAQLDLSFGALYADEMDHGGQQRIFCNGQDVTDAIRTPEVSNYVSTVAAIPLVREVLVQKQQAIAASHSVVMDGRDIGTVVLPQAQYKFFLTASLALRTQRRLAELEAKGIIVAFDQLQAEIALRDQKDAQRAIAPLVAAEDAIYVDTSQMNVDEVIKKLFSIIKK